ncbi:TetR/AcrR family transcriptional regulator [Mycobacterium sp. IDR2000157661]|uniref:TetR/AcrR family transcriptional regulator n=1 Tax=Mycobacterium sp. IDR2000157661 TaxID=2867005 RepID=UPI001EEAFA9A|nr:TetR/AcrR family transcriptional regulator [Mycobacterium sp. IDR2000157661]ULE33452.1 TetR/AcrR family transcriptional regulator [Mycobacterium sp. IDR2000157661]
MAPPRKHLTGAILDATRALVLEAGPRAASVMAIADASGAPAGTLYHRFGNRNGILAAAWLRALERFQRRAMTVAEGTPLDTASAMAEAFVGFARELPQDAQLLLTLRPSDLLDGDLDARFRDARAEMNAPLLERVKELSRQLYGRTDDRAVEAVTRAVVDLPYGVVRRHAFDSPMPPWLEADVAAAARAILLQYQADSQ